jgi:hypothetical protein
MNTDDPGGEHVPVRREELAIDLERHVPSHLASKEIAKVAL